MSIDTPNMYAAIIYSGAYIFERTGNFIHCSIATHPKQYVMHAQQTGR